jgi:hypothetical protein
MASTKKTRVTAEIVTRVQNLFLGANFRFSYKMLNRK